MKIMEFFVKNTSIQHVYVSLDDCYAYISRGVDGWSYLMRSLDIYDYDVVTIDYKTKSAKLRRKDD